MKALSRDDGIGRLVTADPVRGKHMWRGAPGFTAAALVVAHVAWHVKSLSSAYFTQDDYLMLSRSVGQAVTPAFLTQNYSGHVFPGGFLMAWLVANPGRMSWTAAIVPVIVMLAVIGILMWMVLCRLLGSSWVRVPLFAFFLACPLALWSIQWWAVAIQYVPVTMFALLALWCFLKYRQEQHLLSALLVVPCMVGGLLFQERGILAPLILGLVAIADSKERGGRRIVAAVNRHRVLWAVTFGLLVAYLLVHRRLAPISSGFTADEADNLAFVGNLVFRNTLTGLWGGPWWWGRVQSESLVVPSALPVILAVMATGVVVGVTCRRRDRSVVWAWALFAAIALVNVALLFGGRSQLGSAFGLNPRYAADLILPCVVTLALVSGGQRLGPSGQGSGGTSAVPPSRRWSRTSATLVAGGYVVAAAVTTIAFVPSTFNHDDRAYVMGLRASVMAQPERVLFDNLVPSNIMIGWFGEDARLSTVMRATPEDPVFDVPTSRLYMADPKGVIREVALVGITEAAPPPETDDPCGYHVTADPILIPLRQGVDDQRRVVRIGYYIAQPTVATVTIGHVDQNVSLQGGLGSVDLVVDGPVQSVGLRIHDPNGTLCVPSLAIGSPTPLGS